MQLEIRFSPNINYFFWRSRSTRKPQCMWPTLQHLLEFVERPVFIGQWWEIQSKCYRDSTAPYLVKLLGVFYEWQNWIKIANRKGESHKMGMQRVVWINSAQVKVTMGKHGMVWNNSSTHQWHPFLLTKELGEWQQGDTGVGYYVAQRRKRQRGNTGSSWMKKEPQALIFQWSCHSRLGIQQNETFDFQLELHRLLWST